MLPLCMDVLMTFTRCQFCMVSTITDEFFFNVMHIHFAGAEDQIKDFDSGLWALCMTEESKAPPTLYPDDFGVAATTILYHLLGLTPQGITHCNCRNVYLILVHWINALLNSGIHVCSSLTDDDSTDTNTDDD